VWVTRTRKTPVDTAIECLACPILWTHKKSGKTAWSSRSGRGKLADYTRAGRPVGHFALADVGALAGHETVWAHTGVGS